MLASASSATVIKSTSVFLYSEGLGVLYRYCAASAQAWNSTVRTQILEIVHWQQQATTEMCSATQRQPVCLCTHRSFDYNEGEIWSGEAVMISISGLFMLTWRWWTFCWDNSLASPSTHVFCACGIVRSLPSITRRRTGVCGRNWCLAKKGRHQRPSGGQRENTLPTAAHQAVHQGTGQGWWLLHLLVPGFSWIDHGEVESRHLRRFSDLAAHQRSRFRKLNERSGTGSVEGILVVKNFFGNNKARNYTELSSMSDEQRERFHKDLKEMETRYLVRWDVVMMADYCWNLKRDLSAAEHSRSSKKRKFKPWSLNNGEATCNLRVLTFINTHHLVYSNRYFYQVIYMCCWQNIFSLKNIFRMTKICWQKSADNAMKM